MHRGVSWSWETLQKFPALLPALPLRPAPLLCYIHSQLYGKMRTCFAVSNFTQADLERFSSGSGSSAVFLPVLLLLRGSGNLIHSRGAEVAPATHRCQQRDLERLGASPIKISVDHSLHASPTPLRVTLLQLWGRLLVCSGTLLSKT